MIIFLLIVLIICYYARQAMSLDQDEETIYADFNADAYNDLVETQFNNIVKLMPGLGMGESIQEKVLKELSTNLASLMVVENWSINDSYGNSPTISSQSATLQVKSHHSCKSTSTPREKETLKMGN